MRDPRAEALAQILVRYSTRVQKGDVCSIAVDDRRRAARAGDLRGGPAGRRPPIMQLQTERRAGRVLRAGQRRAARLGAAHHRVGGRERRRAHLGDGVARTRASCRSADPSKQARAQKARKPIMETSMRRAAEDSYRWSLTLFPTHAYASEAGMSLPAYEDFYYAACLATDGDPVHRVGAPVRARSSRLADWIAGQGGGPHPGGGHRHHPRRGRPHWIPASASTTCPTASSSPARSRTR